MTSFDGRRDAFENKFAHDEQLRFKVEARRNRLVGQWAAGLLGLSGTDADAYAKSVVIEDMNEPGEEDVFAKLRKDLNAVSPPVTDEQIRHVMADTMQTALAEISKG